MKICNGRRKQELSEWPTVVNVVNVARGAELRDCVTDRGCEAVGSQQLEHLPVGGGAETG